MNIPTTPLEREVWKHVRSNPDVHGMRRRADGAWLFGMTDQKVKGVNMPLDLWEQHPAGGMSVSIDNPDYHAADRLFDKRITPSEWLDRRGALATHSSVKLSLTKLLSRNLAFGGAPSDMKNFDVEVRKFFAKNYGVGPDGLHLSIEITPSYEQVYYVDGD